MYHNCTNPDIYQDMYNRVLIVSDVNLMRGINYGVKPRSGSSRDTDGIDMLFMRKADNERDLLQYVNRASRFGEPSNYYRWAQVSEDLVNRGAKLSESSNIAGLVATKRSQK